jgi:hypothetical protein
VSHRSETGRDHVDITRFATESEGGAGGSL